MMHLNAWADPMGGLHLQMLFCSLLVLAAVFGVVWAIRFAKKEELRNWIIGLVIVGVLGGLLSGLVFGRAQQKWMNQNGAPWMMKNEMMDFGSEN